MGAANKSSPSTHLEPAPPLDMAIIQKFRDEHDSLRVKVQLEAKTDLNTKLVEVTLLGLHEGKVVASQKKLLAEVFPNKNFKRGQTAVVLFEVPAEGLSEYQVKCAWAIENNKPIDSLRAKLESKTSTDIEANPEQNSIKVSTTTVGLSNPAEPMVSRLLRIERNSTECKTPPCKETVSAVIELFNPGKESLAGPKFAIGLKWIQTDKHIQNEIESGNPREGDSLVSLSQVVVPAGGRRKVRLKVDREIPIIPGGRFEPDIRVILP
jgi:hypothetical protein